MIYTGDSIKSIACGLKVLRERRGARLSRGAFPISCAFTCDNLCNAAKSREALFYRPDRSLDRSIERNEKRKKKKTRTWTLDGNNKEPGGPVITL